MDQNFKGKALYNPKGKAQEYSKWATNFYTGCSNACDYCYCRKGVMKTLWSDMPRLKKCFRDKNHAIEMFRKEVYKNREELRKDGVFFSFTTDPLLPETYDLTLEASQFCSSLGINSMILTKRTDTIYKALSYTKHQFDPKYVAFGFTLTGCDELEGLSSSTFHRMALAAELKNLGYNIFFSIEPVIVFDMSLSLIKRTLPFADLYMIGLESDATYKASDVQMFIESIKALITDDLKAKFYIKESIRKYCNPDIDHHFVDKHYNLFNHV